jgi:type IV fimbrial biogenesis protein FimT
MTVVVLIGILAVIAVPSASRAMRENRSSAAAQRVSLMYQTARARAIGRGAAVLVRYKDGKFDVLEAISPDPNMLIPISSCTVPTDRWTNTTMHEKLDGFSLEGQSPYELVKVKFSSQDGDSSKPVGEGIQADVCFTPNGTMLYRTQAAAFSNTTRTLMIQVGQQNSAGEDEGIVRTIFILPNGVARLVTRTGA